MRILVVGAGAIGGYFGGRLLAAGRDVAFLVRDEARRAARADRPRDPQSASATSNVASPPTVTAGKLREPFDVILLSCKAYDLAGAVTSFAPAVGPQTPRSCRCSTAWRISIASPNGLGVTACSAASA